MDILQEALAPYKNLILLFSVLAISSTSLLLFAILRLAQILPAPSSIANSPLPARPPPSITHPTRLVIVLGSGGHTTEMLNMLSTQPSLLTQFTHRTYIISSGDSFSARKALEFEQTYLSTDAVSTSSHNNGDKDQNNKTPAYSVVMVRRARRVHQSWLSTPLTTLLSLWDCIAVLRGLNAETSKTMDTNRRESEKVIPSTIYPDLILTNGPGTGVCVVLGALLLRFFGYHGSKSTPPAPYTQASDKVELYKGQGQMRTIFIESWARVKTLSLSGKILRPVVNRFLVQWPQLAEQLGEGVEYFGPLVS